MTKKELIKKSTPFCGTARAITVKIPNSEITFRTIFDTKKKYSIEYTLAAVNAFLKEAN